MAKLFEPMQIQCTARD